MDTFPSHALWQNVLGTLGWEFDDGSVLIVDEAQLTYSDGVGLWNTVFKPISAHPKRYKNRIVIFASYGSPTGAPTKGTPMVVPPYQQVSLRPIDHANGYWALSHSI